MLVLVQSWPQTACWELNNRWATVEPKSSPCEMPTDKTAWTIHGLWPSRRNARGPTDCGKHNDFNVQLIASLGRDGINEQWPSFKLDLKNSGFWSHEWRYHGTCAKDLFKTNIIYNYFDTTLKLYKKYSIGTALTALNITPGREYDLGSIVTAMKSHLGVNVLVECAINTVSIRNNLTKEK